MNIDDLIKVISKHRINLERLEDKTKLSGRLGHKAAETIINKITAEMLNALDAGEDVKWRRIGTFSRTGHKTKNTLVKEKNEKIQNRLSRSSMEI